MRYTSSQTGVGEKKKKGNSADEKLIIPSLTIPEAMKSMTNLCYEQTYKTF